MNPEITVIIPYYNEAKTLEYTLKQVAQQTLSAKKAIFVNSSSTDNSYNIVDCWIQKNQHEFSTQFINVFENTNNPASSKNVGIRHADTKWLAFMDCGQNFATNWLEVQFNCAEKNNSDVVSGVVCLAGETWFDRCAVAQIYGYKRNVPCVPSTLIKKVIFEKTNLFLEGRRAGYDVAWQRKLHTLGIKRIINEEVKISYIGINYSSNLSHLFWKTSLYAEHTVRIENYLTPYVYIIAPIVVLSSLVISPKLALVLILFYIFGRILVVPIFKSSLLFRDHPLEFLFGTGPVGIGIDFARMVGVLRGIRRYFVSG